MKSSTIIHHDMLAIVHEMPDEMAGRFIKILQSAMVSDIPLPDDFSLKMAIMPFISQIKRDQEKYNSVCDRNRKNIEKRWLNGIPSDTRNTSGINGIPEIPSDTRNTDNDNGSGSDNGSDNDNDNDNENKKKTDLGDKPPVSVISKADCLIVFDHWKKTLNHPRAKLDQKREKLIKSRIKDGYTVETLCDAITGCQLSPWHQGENKDNRTYDDLCLILRDGAHVDQFLRVKENPPNRNLSAQGRQAVDDSMRWLEMHREREQKEVEANER